MASPVLPPTPQHLRALVLDYLCHQAYTYTAQVFARDSAMYHLDADGDHTMSTTEDEILTEEMLIRTEKRREIKLHILSGRVGDAVELLNRHFPTVLSEDAESLASPPASSFHQKSVAPVHLSLNLALLSFIEMCRTVPLDYPPNTTRPKTRLAHVDDPEALHKHQTELLERIQKIYLQVSSLKDLKHKDAFQQELYNVGGLLAYKEPEQSPMAKYLTQERREAVADQINSAILFRLGQPTLSHLELYSRNASVIWTSMHDLRVKLPPLSSRPVGVNLPVPPSPAKGAGTLEKDAVEIVPSFDLRQFLNSS